MYVLMAARGKGPTSPLTCQPPPHLPDPPSLTPSGAVQRRVAEEIITDLSKRPLQPSQVTPQPF